MPAYTLYYFNGRGRAEICRMVFAAAAVQFMDKRIKFSEWNNYKAKMPGSMLPVLEIDGKTQIPQTMAIARYLAREYGFYGKTNIEMARIDFICDCFYEILDDFLRMYNEKDPSRKADWRQVYNDTCRRLLPFMEKTLDMFCNGSHFYMGEQMKLCDMMCYAALENPLVDNPNMLKDYPKIRGLRNRVATHPRISAYFKKRVQTDF